VVVSTAYRPLPWKPSDGIGSRPILNTRPGAQATQGFCHPGFKRVVDGVTGMTSCEPCPQFTHSNGGFATVCTVMAPTWEPCSHTACAFHDDEHCKVHRTENPHTALVPTGIPVLNVVLNGLVPSGIQGLANCTGRPADAERVVVYHHGFEEGKSLLHRWLRCATRNTSIHVLVSVLFTTNHDDVL
jgi:hypothetical protein